VLFEPFDPQPVTAPQRGLRHVGGVVGEHPDEQLAGPVRVAHRQREPHPALEAVPRHDGEADAAEPAGEVVQEPVRLAFRGLGAGLGGAGFRRGVGGEVEKVGEQLRARVAEPVPLEVLGGEAGDHEEVVPHGVEGVDHEGEPLGRGDRSEPVQDPAVRCLREAHGEDHRVVPQPAGLLDVRHREPVRIGEPGRERGILTEGLPDPLGRHGGE